jgi:hypothetical protein
MAKIKIFGSLAVAAAILAILGGCSEKPHLIHVSSDPSGATIFLNDRMIGETPFETILQQREGEYRHYTFKALKDNYKPARQAYKEQLYYQTASDVVPQQLHFVLEERKKYPIAITSEPSGALVSMNGDVVGETPCTAIIRERIGEPRIFDFVAVKEGYEQGHKVLREAEKKENGEPFELPEKLHLELLPQQGGSQQ